MQQLLKVCVLQFGHIGRITYGTVQFSSITRNLIRAQSLRYLCNCNFTTTRKMMVDTSETASRGSIVDILPEKDDNAGYASGGWKSEDGKLSCGYSSFRGKRASMEDFYDVKNSKIDGQTVCLFGIFDG